MWKIKEVWNPRVLIITSEEPLSEGSGWYVIFRRDFSNHTDVLTKRLTKRGLELLKIVFSFNEVGEVVVEHKKIYVVLKHEKMRKEVIKKLQKYLSKEHSSRFWEKIFKF